jgi:hypothetical protein
MKCFYHSADFDGKCGGAIVQMTFPSCELIGIDYGDPFPWDKIKEGELVYMVDFAIQPYEEMLRLASKCELIWIDHHKSALAWARDNNFCPRGRRSIDFAACELVWEFFYEKKIMPRAIRLLGSYDIWKWQSVEGCLEFQMGMKLLNLPATSILWKELFENKHVEDIIKNGGLILQYQKQQDEDTCKYAVHEVRWEGLDWIALNGPFRGSGVFESVWNHKYHGMLVYGWCRDHWRFGLYTDREDVDVSAIAKKYGGGGHKGAAGFQAKVCPFCIGDK